VIALPSHLTQICDLPIHETLAVRLGAIQQTSDARRGEQCMVLRLEGRELLTSDVGAATRHHHGCVPPEERERSAEGVKAFELLFELLIR
jgi:hypothetical protein